MNILICGAGYITEALLKRLGSAWRATLIDKDARRLDLLSNQNESVVRAVAGDASSPVVLEESGIADQDYVLALTGDDRVNLAVARFARESEIKNIMALVYMSENLPRFEEMDVKTIHVTRDVSSTIYRYLQDPRITVTPVAQGRVELMEVEIGPQIQLLGKPYDPVQHSNWRVVGLLRKNNLMAYDMQTVLQRGDRLLILGQADVFRQVCSLIGCDEPHFPRIYGNSLALGMPAGSGLAGEALLKESLHLLRNTKLQQMTAICKDTECVQLTQRIEAPQQVQLDVIETGSKLVSAVRQHCRETNVGLVVLPLLEKAVIDVLAKPVHITLAHSLPCPLMVAKNTHPYERILVPFNGSPIAVTALEAAFDLAAQIDASVTAAVIKEPDFLHGTEEEDPWADGLVTEVRKVALAYKRPVEEVIKTGNPVAEITGMTEFFNLIVIGSTTEEKEFLEPHIGELLVRKSACSALVITH